MTTRFFSAHSALLALTKTHLVALSTLCTRSHLHFLPVLIPSENGRLILKKAGLNLNNLDFILKNKPFKTPIFQIPAPRIAHFTLNEAVPASGI